MEKEDKHDTEDTGSIDKYIKELELPMVLAEHFKKLGTA